MDEYKNSVVPKDLGDGLYLFGGALFCEYPVKGTDIKDDHVIFDYGVYSIKVSWTNTDDGKRIDPKWERIYPDSSGGGS